jgi:hypothetical protein
LRLVRNRVNVEVSIVGNTEHVFPAKVDNTAVCESVGRVCALVGVDTVERLVHRISDVRLIPVGTVDLLGH